jgi:pimeloyl-ACP methyl ester carboxylesterase
MRVETDVASEDFDLALPSGRLRVRRHGPAGAPLVIGIPGLSANLVSFDFTGERIAGSDRQLVALDLRGRGFSEVTPPGTYGWPSHARDVLAVADALGAERFALIGHSMGAAVAMVCARAAADRIERLVLVDAVGAPEEKSAAAIAAAVARLGATYPSIEGYLGLVQGIGTVRPWSEYWERYFRYEMRQVEGGVTARSDARAVLEDSAFGAGALSFDADAAIYQLWKYLTMPALLVRATQEILPGFGHIVKAEDARRFAAEVTGGRVVEVDANHYGVATSEAAAAAIAEFLA